MRGAGQLIRLGRRGLPRLSRRPPTRSKMIGFESGMAHDNPLVPEARDDGDNAQADGCTTEIQAALLRELKAGHPPVPTNPGPRFRRSHGMDAAENKDQSNDYKDGSHQSLNPDGCAKRPSKLHGASPPIAERIPLAESKRKAASRFAARRRDPSMTQHDGFIGRVVHTIQGPVTIAVVTSVPSASISRVWIAWAGAAVPAEDWPAPIWT